MKEQIVVFSITPTFQSSIVPVAKVVSNFRPSDSEIPGKFLTLPYWTKVQYTAQPVFARRDYRPAGFSESSDV